MHSVHVPTVVVGLSLGFDVAGKKKKYLRVKKKKTKQFSSLVMLPCLYIIKTRALLFKVYDNALLT